MRTHALVILAAAASLSACIKRVAPSAGPDQTGISGVPLTFGKAQELPEGASIRWEFGDGDLVEGAQVTHAFPREGAFLATQVLKLKGGAEERATARVTILRRAVPSAIPADARAALVLERPWQRARLHKELAERMGLADAYADYLSGLKAGLGFNFTDAPAATAAGIDVEEGVALYTVPQDAEALVLAVGITDPKRGEVALRGLLTRPPDGLGPFEFTEGKLADGTRAVLGLRARGGQRVAFVERYGYLYLRTPGLSDPLLALASAATLPADGGLAKEESWNHAFKQVGPGDALFWAASPRGDKGDGMRPGGRLAGEFGSTAFSIAADEEFVRLRLFGQLRSLAGNALVEALTPTSAPTDLASELPAGAAAFFKLSGSLPILWRELMRGSGTDTKAVGDRIHEWLGVNLETGLLPAVTGNGVVGVYLDATALLEAFLGEQVAAWDRSTFLLAGQVVDGKQAVIRAALDRASKEQGGPHEVNGATFWRLTDGLQAALRGTTLLLAVGGAPEAAPETASDKAFGPIGGPAVMLARDPSFAFGRALAFQLAAASATPKKPPPAASKKPAAAPSKKPAPAATKAAPKASASKAPPAKPTPSVEEAWQPTPQTLGPLSRILLAPAGAPTLGAKLKTAELWSLDKAQHQVGWLDIAGIVAALDGAADAQGGLAAKALKLLTTRARNLRDLVLDAEPSSEGISAQVMLRLRPRPATPPAAPPRSRTASDMSGSIEVICGPMFSGKTEELIRRLKRALIAKRKVQIFKPRIDARYDAEAVVSHSAQKLRSTVIDRAEEIPALLTQDTQVIGIDEVQFFGPNVVAVVEGLANRGVRVIVAGLDLDYRGVPFEPVPQLLALAESILKVPAICVVCGEPATRSQRTIAAEDRVLVGATGQYEARCRACFSPEARPATAVPEQALLPFLD